MSNAQDTGSDLSFTQEIGVIFSMIVYMVLGVALLLCCLNVIRSTIGFAVSQAPSFGHGVVLVIFGIVLEVVKYCSTLIYYNQRHYAPKMAAGALSAFCALAVFSFFTTLSWQITGGSDPAMVTVLVFSHILSAAGPVVWTNATKWAMDSPADGQPRQPQPVQQSPAPQQGPVSPQGYTQGYGAPAATLEAAFNGWTDARLSPDPAGQLDALEAFNDFIAWSQAHQYPIADQNSFEDLLTRFVHANGFQVAGQHVLGVTLTQANAWATVS